MFTYIKSGKGLSGNLLLDAVSKAVASIVEMAGGTPKQTAEAMAITLKNMLGLVCDPVAGLVEVSGLIS